MLRVLNIAAALGARHYLCFLGRTFGRPTRKQDIPVSLAVILDGLPSSKRQPRTGVSLDANPSRYSRISIDCPFSFAPVVIHCSIEDLHLVTPLTTSF